MLPEIGSQIVLKPPTINCEPDRWGFPDDILHIETIQHVAARLHDHSVNKRDRRMTNAVLIGRQQLKVREIDHGRYVIDVYWPSGSVEQLIGVFTSEQHANRWLALGRVPFGVNQASHKFSAKIANISP